MFMCSESILYRFVIFGVVAVGVSLIVSGCASTDEEEPPRTDLECDCSVSPNIAALPSLEGRAASIGPDIRLDQRPAPSQFRAKLVEASLLVRADEARRQFNVNGKGLTAAVLDTGIRRTHADFGNRVLAVRNFTSGDPNAANDNQGHGTHVAGVVAANGPHTGLAPGANLVALKVLADDGSGDFEWLADALQWVLDNAEQHRITVVSMSLGANVNLTSDNPSTWPELSRRIQNLVRELTNRRIPVVMAAGNSFYDFESVQGMSFPSIIREGISVAAVYDDDVGPRAYGSGAEATATGKDHISPFTQRLHPCVNEATRTDIFAPGAPMTSTGIQTDRGEATMSGTSQATPTITGVVLLLQEYYLRRTGNLPTVEQLTRWLRTGGVMIIDGDNEKNNVRATGCDFLRVDAVNALSEASHE